MTPEELAMQTGWSLYVWRSTEHILGVYWFARLWRQMSELAGLTGKSPDEIALMLVGDEQHPGLLYS